MELARNANQLGRPQHDDAASSTRIDESNAGPFSTVLFREIHKNAWLRKMSVEKKLGAFSKKGDKVWVVFCVHDDAEAFLELYNCKKTAVAHKPDWFVSLNNCLHVSPTLCPQEDEYEFVVTLSTDVIRLSAPSWDLMMEWVECVGSKLREMHILSPRENLYSRNPESGPRLPLAPTRDPNSPLPLPPAGPSTSVPGIEQSTATAEESSSTSSEPSSEVSSNSDNLSGDSIQFPHRSGYDDVDIQQRSCMSSLYISQSEPPIYRRPRHVLSRAASVPDSNSSSAYSSSPLSTPTLTRNVHQTVTDEDNNVTIVRISSDYVPMSADSHPAAVFNFNFPEVALDEREDTTNNSNDLIPEHNEATQRQQNTENATIAIDSRSEVGETSPAEHTDSSSHYECVFLPRIPIESSASPQSSEVIRPSAVSSPPPGVVVREAAAMPEEPRADSRSRRTSTSETQSLPQQEQTASQRVAVASRPIPIASSSVGTGVRLVERQDVSQAVSSRGIEEERRVLAPPPATRQSGVVTMRSAAPVTAGVRPVDPQAGLSVRAAGSLSAGRIVERMEPAMGNSLRGADPERRLQPAPHPYHRQIPGENGTSNNASRLTLREQQVLQLRREMAHPGGVRLQLRRKDCLGSVALVDAFGAVWIAGWKQREHPMLYNALHIGDQLLSVAGIPVQSAADANRLIRGALGLYVEFIIRRLPFGRVFALHREAEGQNLGIVQEGNTAEVREVIQNSPAARAGLPARAPTCCGLSLTTWTLTEINGRPLNLFFKDNEVRDRLNAIGKEVSILVQPSDLVRQLKKQLKSLRGYKDYIVQ